MKLHRLKIPPGKRIAVDTETTGLLARQGCRPFAVSMCNEEGVTGYCEWPVDPHTRRVMPRRGDLATLRSFMADDRRTKVFQHAEFDVTMLEQFRCPTKGRIEELMFASHCANTLEPSFGLKQLAKKYLHAQYQSQDVLEKETKRARGLVKKFWIENNCAGLKRDKKELAWNEKGRKEFPISQSHKADYWLLQHFNTDMHHVVPEYAIEDAVTTMTLFLMYEQELKEEGTWESYEVEVRLWPVTHAMIARGVRVNPATTRKEIAEKGKIERVHLKELIKKTWPDFNPNSDPQVRKLLFDKCALPIYKETATGLPSIAAETLAMYRDEYPVLNTLLKYRHATKAVQFFKGYEALTVKDKINEGGFCIHPGFKQVGAKTSRYSCSDPNLQNVPDAATSRSIEPIQGKAPFEPRPGYYWFSYDYEQIEVKIFAVVAEITSMLEAIHAGRDIHTECANRAWGGKGNPSAIWAARDALELDTGEAPGTDAVREAVAQFPNFTGNALAEAWLRTFDYDISAAEKSVGKKNSKTKAKSIVFGKLFVGGPLAIMDSLKCTYEEAAEFLNVFDKAFPEMKPAMRAIMNQGERDGFITTLYGRRIAVDPYFSYRAVNYMVQGSAAGLLKQALINTSAYLDTLWNIDAHIVLTIHDEITFEIKIEDAHPWLLRRLKKIMEDTKGVISCPTPVAVSRVVKRWDMEEKITL